MYVAPVNQFDNIMVPIMLRGPGPVQDFDLGFEAGKITRMEAKHSHHIATLSPVSTSLQIMQANIYINPTIRV